MSLQAFSRSPWQHMEFPYTPLTFVSQYHCCTLHTASSLTHFQSTFVHHLIVFWAFLLVLWNPEIVSLHLRKDDRWKFWKTELTNWQKLWSRCRPELLRVWQKKWQKMDHPEWFGNWHGLCLANLFSSSTRTNLLHYRAQFVAWLTRVYIP